MSIFSRVIVPALMAALHFAGTPAAFAQMSPAAADQPSEETWNSIKGDIFKDRPILDGSGLVILDAPRRAEDSALVPIGMRVNFADDDKRTLQSLTLVIDENPAPVAGTFTIGPRSGVTSISTRVRVNSYSYVRADRRTQRRQALWRQGFREGVRRMLGAGVIECRRHQIVLGQMKFRTFRAEAGALPEAQFMMRHPQNFGPADGPVDAALHPAVLYREPQDLAGRRSRDGDGWRDRDLGRSEHPFQLQAQRRRQFSRRSASIPASICSRTNGRSRNRCCSSIDALERDDFSSNRHRVLCSCLSMSSAQTRSAFVARENRCPLFRIMLQQRRRKAVRSSGLPLPPAPGGIPAPPAWPARSTETRNRPAR